MADSDSNGAGPEPGDERLEALRGLVRQEIAGQLAGVSEELKALLRQGLEAVEGRRPDPAQVAHEAVEVLRAEARQAQAAAVEEARQKLAGAGAKDDGAARSGETEEKPKARGAVTTAVMAKLAEDPIGTLSQALDLLFDKAIKFKELTKKPDNPFELATLLGTKYPDIAQFFAGRWAPDPLYNELPRVATDAFTMGMRSRQAGLQAFRTETAPSTPGASSATPGSGPTVAPVAPPPAPTAVQPVPSAPARQTPMRPRRFTDLA